MRKSGLGIIDTVYRKAKSQPRTIVLPEVEDSRIIEAAEIIRREKLANVILLDKNKISSEQKQEYAQAYYQLRKNKGLSLQEAQEVVNNPLYYAAMMTRLHKADGFVAGASHTTPDVARSAIRCLGIEKRFNLVTSCFIMLIPDCEYGEKGAFVFADCGIIPEPNARQLACIAVLAAEITHKVLGVEPRIALLSYSTHGSSQSKFIDKVRQAKIVIRQISPGLLVDGEIQADAAIVPQIAAIKCPDSILAGEANTLIFPDLEAGNICYKLVQRLTRARAIGPLLLGLQRPASDLSRGCSIADIVDAVAVTAIRAQS
jgi:phosphate acetyltransferase